MRCRFPSCEADVWSAPKDPLPTWMRCREHRHLDSDEDTLLTWAQEYAVACILYYECDAPRISDGEFDDLCSALLQRRAWEQIAWLDEGMLTAGSGYDLARFPMDLHRAAKEFSGQEKKASSSGFGDR